ncbi:MAG: tetratricopeptide repeat protein [Planctomycetota bacterium]|nr:tetratricopeptide repeat protein [Planctomycetota bacterium]
MHKSSHRRTVLAALLLTLTFSACGTTATHAVLDVDLGAHTRAASTTSTEAQRWFDQGLTWLYSFNHDEAIHCFSEAVELDPGFAMAWWGIANANGPHINFPLVPPERDRFAREAVKRARTLSVGATPVERALIGAQFVRWGETVPTDRRPLDEAYAEAMLAVTHEHPRDADVAALAAEALMDLQPWDLWTRAGAPKGRVNEILALLEGALESDPSHPLANHLYIHATEGSARPELALAAADRLRDLVPGAGHMVHMPSHTYVRTGRLADASLANERAIEVDASHRDRFPRDGFYRVYMMHNAHFLAFSSMLEGRSDAAMTAAKRMLADLPPEFVASVGPMVDGYLPVVLHVLVRFGRWEEILREPAFPEEFLVANGVRHYARGVALNVLGRAAEAQEELAALDAIVTRLDDRPVGNNPAKSVLRIPRLVLAGEIAFAAGRRDEGIGNLAEAAEIDASLVYDEPPDWMMPVRHPYGAMLLEAGRWNEAERAFREDLKLFPENGWSLFGLERALREQGRAKEADGVAARFARAWSRADVEIHAPCLCQPGKKLRP